MLEEHFDMEGRTSVTSLGLVRLGLSPEDLDLISKLSPELVEDGMTDLNWNRQLPSCTPSTESDCRLRGFAVRSFTLACTEELLSRVDQFCHAYVLSQIAQVSMGLVVVGAFPPRFFSTLSRYKRALVIPVASLQRPWAYMW